MNNTIQLIAIAIIPVLFAIILHEVSHGYVAHIFGDDTAKNAGRLTLNPLKHIDPFGTIILPIVLIFLAGFAFGYAKPVPVNFNGLRNPKRDTGFVAAAGPVTNFLLALVSFILLKIILANFPIMNFYLLNFIHNNLKFQAISGGLFLRFFIYPVTFMLFISIMINLLLGVFNLIPIPPLDGGRVAVSILPEPLARILSKLEPFGIFIILLLLLIDPGNFLIALGNFIVNLVLKNL